MRKINMQIDYSLCMSFMFLVIQLQWRAADSFWSKSSHTAIRKPVLLQQLQDQQQHEVVIESHHVEYRPGINCHYETVSMPQHFKQQQQAPTVHIIFLPGFGVGTFHFERNMKTIVKQLSAPARPVCCHSLDWIGQGRSWPNDEQSAIGLRICAGLWCDQLAWFIKTQLSIASGEVEFFLYVYQMKPVIKSDEGDVQAAEVYLAGNSLGGFLAVQLAAELPSLIKGLVLMNATPIWSFQPPIFSRSLTSSSGDRELWREESNDSAMLMNKLRPFGWTADLPAPALLRWLGGSVFGLLRNEEIIKGMLSLVYSDAEQLDTALVNNIQQGASHPLGPDAFTSIMFAPKLPYTFEEQLQRLDARMPCLLLYGADDPWVVPTWGDRTYRRLMTRSSSDINGQVDMYYLSPAGHCVHHEVSDLVNDIICHWLTNQQQSQQKDDTRNQFLKDEYRSQKNNKPVIATRYFGDYDKSFIGQLSALTDRLLL